MPAQGNALGFGIRRLRCVLKGRRILRPFRADHDAWPRSRGVARADILRAVAAKTWTGSEPTVEESSSRMTVAMRSELERSTKALTYALLGGLVFWTPNVVVHWIIAYRFSGLVVLGLTVLLPATTILFFRTFLWPSLRQESRLSLALFAVLGIWITGPSMLTFSSSFCGGGLTQPDAWRFFVFGTLLFPLFTLVMSAYDGTFFALLLTTLLLPILANSRFKEAVRRYQ